MICLRCGYCCKTCCVVIVVDPDKGPVKGNLKAVNLLEEPCPHLRGSKPGEYSCAVHDRKWYKKTPCFAHGQIERGNQECRMGRFLLDKEKESPRSERDIIPGFEPGDAGAIPAEGTI